MLGQYTKEQVNRMGGNWMKKLEEYQKKSLHHHILIVLHCKRIKMDWIQYFSHVYILSPLGC